MLEIILKHDSPIFGGSTQHYYRLRPGTWLHKICTSGQVTSDAATSFSGEHLRGYIVGKLFVHVFRQTTMHSNEKDTILMVSNGKTGHVVQQKCISIRFLEGIYHGKIMGYTFYTCNICNLIATCSFFYVFGGIFQPLMLGYLQNANSTNFLVLLRLWLKDRTNNVEVWWAGGRLL